MATIEITQMRNVLLPGLMEIVGSYSMIPAAWESVFADAEAKITTELAALVPPVSLPVAAAMGVAAVVIKNPKVERRSLFSWLWGR